jgi:NAD/NADP transhydrogenase beta subunit
MTSMPEMVALFNGFGGLASLLRRWRRALGGGERFTLVTIVLSILIGGVTFTGSLVAWGKLSETIGSGAVPSSAASSGQQHHRAGAILFAAAVLAVSQPHCGCLP